VLGTLANGDKSLKLCSKVKAFLENPDSRILDDMADDYRLYLVAVLRTWLGPIGLEFFQEMLEKHKTVSPVFPVSAGGNRIYPHAVHSHEGMQVRNYLRSLPETSFWSVYDYDNCWADLVHEAVTGSKPSPEELLGPRESAESTAPATESL
jgi:hypothetical protein